MNYGVHRVRVTVLVPHDERHAYQFFEGGSYAVLGVSNSVYALNVPKDPRENRRGPVLENKGDKCGRDLP
jgi:hypothetical protein